MQAVVPAAGEGTRLRPLTEDRPKGLVEVAGKPLLTHVFEALCELDPTEIVVIDGYRGEDIRSHYGRRFDDVPLTYVRQESRRGLAHALLQAEPHVTGDFVVLNGDNVVRANLMDVVTRHRETNADVTSLVEAVPSDRLGKGAVFKLADDETVEGADTDTSIDSAAGGRIIGIVEKPDDPPSTFVPRGFYAFSPRIFSACRLVTPGETGEYELTDAIDLLLAAGRRLETVRLDGWCHNVNTPEDRTLVASKLRV